MNKAFSAKVVLAILAAGITSLAIADGGYVNGYSRKDGTYVQGHLRSSPNETKLDNYSTQGNVNPFTGRHGVVNPSASPHPNPYFTPYLPRTSPQSPTQRTQSGYDNNDD